MLAGSRAIFEKTYRMNEFAPKSITHACARFALAGCYKVLLYDRESILRLYKPSNSRLTLVAFLYRTHPARNAFYKERVSTARVLYLTQPLQDASRSGRFPFRKRPVQDASISIKGAKTFPRRRPRNLDFNELRQPQRTAHEIHGRYIFQLGIYLSRCSSRCSPIHRGRH